MKRTKILFCSLLLSINAYSLDIRDLNYQISRTLKNKSQASTLKSRTAYTGHDFTTHAVVDPELGSLLDYSRFA